MKPEFKDAIKLHNEGYSPEEIAKKIGISRATAYRWVDQHQTSLIMAGIDEELDDSDQEIQDTPTLGAIQESNQLKKQELERQEHQESIRKEKENRSLVKKLKALCSLIKDHTNGGSWDPEEVEHARLEIEDILEGIEEHADYDPDTIEQNSAYQILKVIQDEFEQFDESESNHLYIFNWTPPMVNLLDQALAIDKIDDSEFELTEHYVETANYQVAESMNGI